MKTKLTIDYDGPNEDHQYWLEVEIDHDAEMVLVSDCASYFTSEDKSISTIAISKETFLKTAKLLELF